MNSKIAFTCYETPYAPCGGIAAVMAHLPAAMRAVSERETYVITPYHYRIKKTQDLALDWIAAFNILFEYQPVRVQVGRLNEGNVTWIFLRVDDARFFAGVRHPYDVAPTQQEIGDCLRRDALFYGAAAAQSLAALDPDADWILLMQDWEGATVQLGLDPSVTARPFLTLHNSYDSGGIDPADLRRVGIDPARCPGPSGSTRASVLERVLVGRATPVFTVSEQFAADLAEDVAQARVMAPHLQSLLAGRLVGVNNGPFARLEVDPAVLAAALAGDEAPFQTWKAGRKAEARQALEAFEPSPDRPAWGSPRQFQDLSAPWFVMAGRDDTRQKGYDVAALAVQEYLQSGMPGHFLFFPIPGDEGQAGLGFLQKLAAQNPERVLVMPFIFKEGFKAALQGATWGLMPSLYEPFGMANEFYLNGTPGIGRATGGIVQQIVPWRAGSAFTPAVERRARRWYAPDQPASGVLFREPDGIPSEMDDWRWINQAGYHPSGAYPNRVEARGNYPLIQNMAAQLLAALRDGESLARQPQAYAQMLAQGIEHIQTHFSWPGAAQTCWDRLLQG